MRPDSHGHEVDRLNRMVAARNKLIAGLVVICAFLSASNWYQLGSEKQHLVPPNLGSGAWVSGQAVSRKYLEDLTAYAAHVLYDVTPKNVAFQQDQFFELVDPEDRQELKKNLAEIQARIAKDGSSSIFEPSTIEADPENLRSAITGVITTYLGRRPVGEESKTFLFQYKRNKAVGRLYVKSVHETQPDHPFDPAPPAGAGK